MYGLMECLFSWVVDVGMFDIDDVFCVVVQFFVLIKGDLMMCCMFGCDDCLYVYVVEIEVIVCVGVVIFLWVYVLC